ncbi:MAG: ABC transporter substrate-binding protein [Clostridiales Family XIII bacterium]|jgi:ABC-type Fe3+-hydroxamate transport system substrate-binding protein|nr:ABC transporter substrate-binding protein [Clostridiales Family XIII bacterium]
MILIDRNCEARDRAVPCRGGLRKVLLVVLLAALLCACGGPAGKTVPDAPLPDDSTVVDASGEAHAVRSDREALTFASVYAVAVPFVVALGLSDRALAINCKSAFWTENVPALAEAGSVGRGTVDFEKLAALAPDILLHRANDPRTVSGALRVGVPVFGISAEDVDGIYRTIDLLGTYFGAEARAGEVKGFLQGKLAAAAEIVAQIPESERLTAVCFGGSLGRIAGGDMLQTKMIEMAGGIPAAQGTTNNGNWMEVGAERILAMDPDVIFLTGSTVLDYDVDSLKSDPAWRGMKAVREGRIYRIPAQVDAWDLPGISCGLGVFYMLRAMYPERLSDERLRTEMDEYYTFMFGHSFTPEEIGARLP